MSTSANRQSSRPCSSSKMPCSFRISLPPRSAPGREWPSGPRRTFERSSTENRCSTRCRDDDCDERPATAVLRDRGVKDVALVGSSMGGSAVLASSFEGDVECVVAISAPVAAIPDELSKKITGRKLFVCADRDSLRATPNVLGCFTAASAPKKLVLFGGREHSRAMFSAAYGDEALGEIVEFVCRRG